MWSNSDSNINLKTLLGDSKTSFKTLRLKANPMLISIQYQTQARVTPDDQEIQ
jgi:hypothetical protein